MNWMAGSDRQQTQLLPGDLLKLYLYGYLHQLRVRRWEYEASLERLAALKNFKPGGRPPAPVRAAQMVTKVAAVKKRGGAGSKKCAAELFSHGRERRRRFSHRL